MPDIDPDNLMSQRGIPDTVRVPSRRTLF